MSLIWELYSIINKLFKVIPSSVKVPVLSKQTVYTLPPIITLPGDIHDISTSSSLYKAKLWPTYNVAVTYAGTLVDTKFIKFKIRIQ